MYKKFSLLIIFSIILSSAAIVYAEDYDDYIEPVQEQDENIGIPHVVTDTAEIDEILEDAVVFSIGKTTALVNGVRCSLSESESRTVPVEEDGFLYIPAKFIARAYGGEYERYEPAKISYLKFTNYVIHFADGENTYYINGKPYDAERGAAEMNSEIYVPADIIEKAMCKNFFYGDGGIIIISDEKISMNDDTKRELLNYIVGKMFYERPDRERILNDLKKTNPNKQHPRILLNAEKAEQLKILSETDEQYKTWKEKSLNSAESALNMGHAAYILPNGQLLQQSRNVLALMQQLSMGYLFTQDRRYAERAFEEIKNVGSFPDWNPRHFLDVGEMAAAISIAYDWMYDGFTEEERKEIRNIIKVKAFYPALEAYRQTGPKLPSTQCQWIYADTNWNAVCNGGIGMAAMAMADEEDVAPEALECLEGSIKSLENMMCSFAPDGAWFEGVGYWQYTIQYLVRYISSLEASLGSDYGLFDAPGVKETAYFPIYLTGPNSVFSFGDSGNSKVDVPEWNYFASRLHDPAIAARREQQLKNGGGGFSDMIWRDPTIDTEDVTLTMDKYFGGIAEICTMRSAWDDEDAIFVGTRAGRHTVNHGHADIGSYTLDANGVNWAVDAGGGDYSWYEYFGSERYKYYRLRAESHNMVVVNPDQNTDIDMSKTTHIKLETKERGAFATMDMTEAYSQHDVKKAVRAMGLIDNRTKFIVQDEIETNKDGDFYWFMHTKADVTISQDGKTALLEQGGKKMHMQILSPADGTFSVGPDMKLPTSPSYPEYEKQSNYYKTDIQKISIHVDGRNSVDFSVVMTPLKSNEHEPETMPQFIKIDDWEIPDGSMPVISSLSVDGKPLKEFKPQTYNYIMEYDKAEDRAPVIDASSDEYDIEITQAEAIPGTAIVDVLENGVSIKKYYVNFNITVQLGLIEGKTKHKVADVTASEVPEAVNTPQNLIDNDLSTKWAAQGNQWVTFDLGTAKAVDTVAISWMSPDTRISPFEIQISDDGKEWKQIYSGRSSGIKTDFDNYSFNEVTTRYVRICVHGYNDGAGVWNSVMEVGIFGK